MDINLLLLIIRLLICQLTIALPTTDAKVDRTDSSYGTGIVNTQIHTIVEYHEQQIYIYKSLSNDPKNQIYYYVPIMFPKKKLNTNWIWTSGRGELRINIMFGNDEIDNMARKEIVKTGENGTFKVAPLIIDSFAAFIVDATSKPVSGVQPFRRIHPSDKTMTIRFECSSEVVAQAIMSRVIEGDYDVEFAFFFAGLNKVSTSMVSITSDSLKYVLSKTRADGGNTNAAYIHRAQTNKFVSIYMTNVRKMIYKEEPSSNTSSLTAGLEDQLISLIQQAMDNTKQEKLGLNMYGQIWSSDDLNPDRLTSELNKIFTYNQAETNYRNTSDKYFDFNEEYARSLAVSAAFKGSAGILGIASASMDTSASVNKAESGASGKTTHDVISLTDIKKYLDQKSIETEWKGEQILPKSFQVYKLTDITDNLQVALIAIELKAEKTNNAMIRTLSALNLPPTFGGFVQTGVIQSSICMIGEIRLYAADSHPPFPWLFCNGTTISRIEYQRLFSIIGTNYGAGDGSTTFNLPDFRGRVPVGVDKSNIIIADATSLGRTGGQATQILTVDQLPSHTHESGTFYAETAGDHSHSYQDPGHDHHGQTGEGPSSSGSFAMNPRGGSGNEGGRHRHLISRDTTHITINSAGIHTHKVAGQSGNTGNGQSFSLLQPYQTVNYIIYSA